MRMDIDQDKVDQAVLALLSLGRLDQKGYITDPVGKAKSIVYHGRRLAGIGTSSPCGVLPAE